MRRRAAGWAVNGLLLAGTAVALFPLAWMVSVSFMHPGESGTLPPPLLPSDATLANYRTLFLYVGIGRYLANSLGLAAAITLLSLAFNLMAGYAFARLRFRGRAALFKGMIGALVIPAQVAMLPLFLLMKYLGLVNSYAGVVLPALAGVFGIFLVREYARGIPRELLEAARMDGAGEFRTFFTISIRLLVPGIVTVLLFTVVATWNNYFLPLIMLSDPAWYPLTVGLNQWAAQSIGAGSEPVYNLVIMGSLLTIIPIIVAFLLLQRFWQSGLSAGSVKQ